MIEALKISLITYLFTALGQHEGMIFYPYQRLISKLPKWIRYPLGGCFVCFTGQVCMWFYLLNYHVRWMNIYSIIDFLWFISIGISASMIYDFIYSLIND